MTNFDTESRPKRSSVLMEKGRKKSNVNIKKKQRSFSVNFLCYSIFVSFRDRISYSVTIIKEINKANKALQFFSDVPLLLLNPASLKQTTINIDNCKQIYSWKINLDFQAYK